MQVTHTMHSATYSIRYNILMCQHDYTCSLTCNDAWCNARAPSSCVTWWHTGGKLRGNVGNLDRPAAGKLPLQGRLKVTWLSARGRRARFATTSLLNHAEQPALGRRRPRLLRGGRGRRQRAVREAAPRPLHQIARPVRSVPAARPTYPSAACGSRRGCACGPCS